MDKEELKFIAWFLTAVATACLCGLGGCYITERTKQEAIKAGLIEKPAGGNTTVWTKP